MLVRRGGVRSVSTSRRTDSLGVAETCVNAAESGYLAQLLQAGQA